jgi:hypothetical protein
MLGAASVLDPPASPAPKRPARTGWVAKPRPSPGVGGHAGRLGRGRAVWGTLSVEQTVNNLLTEPHWASYACPMFVQSLSNQQVRREEVPALVRSSPEARTRAPKLLFAFVFVPGAGLR